MLIETDVQIAFTTVTLENSKDARIYLSYIL